MKKLLLIAVLILSLLELRSQNCPTSINVNAPSMDVESGKPFQFSAMVNGGPLNVSITYNWSISTGIIVAGQGTSVITVEAGDSADNCTATVDIGGLPRECSSSSSATVTIKKGPEKIITVSLVTNAGLNDAVKKFISKTDFKNIKLSQNALVNVYAINSQQFAKIKAQVEKFFTANGILSFQYTIADAGINKVAMVDMFLIKNSY